MKKTLSVVLATFNEERNIVACLDSLKDIADEIIIVDGTSSDKTVEIAKKYGAKVKVTTNKPNFHINKQMAIDMATKDWVLQMDADEHLSKELKEEIVDVLKSGSDEFNGFWMPRKNWFIGRFLLKGGQYPDHTLRFYKRGKGRLPVKDVHEQAKVDGKVGYFKGALFHYPYKNFTHYLKKWNAYNNLLAKQIREEQAGSNVFKKIISGFNYLLIKPIYWFLLSFIRHKGFMDLWAGFVFSLFSSLRFPVSYLKYLGGFKIGIFLILFLSFAIRFYNFPNRWGLSGDDGRDALVGLEAIKRREILLIGPFSSAGPFVFGPIYYWLIMFSYLLFPFLMSAPWLITGLIGVATVAIFTYLGYLIGGKRVAILSGILAAFSPQLVVRSLILGPHTYVSTFASLTILCFLLLCFRKKQIYALLMGVSLGIAVNAHYQALNLLIFFPAVFFVKNLGFAKKITAFFLALVGFIIPSFPLLYWDYFQSFANLRNILDYFLIGQYRIYVPNSWTLYFFNYFPNYWSFVVGRYSIVALVLVVLSGLTFAYRAFIKRNISRPLFILGIIFFIFFVVGRFYKGERSEGYLLYLLPFILIFTAWVIDNIYSLRLKGIKQSGLKYLAVLILILLVMFNSITIYNTIRNESPIKNVNNGLKNLFQQFPNSKFDLYDYQHLAYSGSMPVSFVMSWKNMMDKNGIPLGVVCSRQECPTFSYPLVATISGNPIYDLRGVKFEKNPEAWVSISRPSTYDEVIGWSKKNQLKSNFSLKKYIINMLGGRQ
jgi:glycosyltransferase involved in cell wall biosynthesis